MNEAKREFAIELARRAGDLLMAIRSRGLDPEATRTKLGHNDIVTEGDFASEKLIVDALRAAYPDDAVYAEESAGGGLPAAEWVWIIDPVDGTTNYAHGLPLFAVNIALAHHAVPVLGVTHIPSFGLTYWAEEGGGAWVRSAAGDARIRVSEIDELKQALLATGFVAERGSTDGLHRTEFAALDVQTQSVRRMGSAAVVMAWIAAGMLEGYWESGLKPWDIASGWLLVVEAGGRITQYDAAPFRLHSATMVVTNGRPAVHDGILATIADVRAQLGRR